MPISVSRSSANSRFSRLANVIGPSAPHLTLFTICLLLLLYGYEIFNFSLSIDEEAYGSDFWLVVIANGRWATGLLARAFPPLGSIPMISTLMFCAGLGVSACVLGRVLFRNHSAQLAFVGIFVSSPLWPHLAEFNISSWCVGIGCVLLTLALLLFLAEDRLGDVWVACLLAFATGISESFFVWFLVLLCVLHLSVLLGTATAGVTEARQKFPWLRSGLIAGGGLLGYLAMQRLVLAAFSLKLDTYVKGFMRLEDFIRVPARALSQTLLRCWKLLSGTDPIYLGYGHVLTLLSLLGLLIVVIRLLRRGPLSSLQRLMGGAILVAALGLALSPILVSAGTAPVRAFFPWIPMSAFLAGVTLTHSGRFKTPLYFVLSAALFISIWISVSLFYTDHLVRQRDQLLAARIMARVDQILPNPPPGQIPFVVVGGPPARDEDSFRKIEIFGDSYFDLAHEGGNPYRIAAYLRLLGVNNLEPHLLEDAAHLRPVIEAMPVWPAAGSVAIVSGMLVIKLGPTPPA